MSFLGEIKRRRVFQVAVVYAVVAWLLVQIVDVLNDPLSLPGWLDTVVVVLLAVGFPIAIILAWAFDLTPAGVVRTPAGDTADDEPKITPLPGPFEARREILHNSVAVLPLDNLSPNPDDAYFAAGIHEEILNYVAKIKDINVIARTSVKKYQGSEKSIAEIAIELGVGTIMEGSVRYAGDRVRVTAQLIDASTENHLWSEVYERDLADIFSIQADIAERVAAALAAELSPAEKKSLETLPTNSTEAYERYLRAVALNDQRAGTIGASPELRATVEKLLDEALAADPDFAAAYVLRAFVLTSTLNQDPGEKDNIAERRSDLENRALADLEEALKIDSSMGAAYAGMARIHQFNWRGEEALAAYERALELAPKNAFALLNFAVFRAETGHCDEALELAHRAVALDPNSGTIQWLAWIHICNDDFRPALKIQQRATALAPGNGVAFVVLADIERELGDPEGALQNLRIAEKVTQDELNPAYLAELTRSFGLLDRHEDAVRIFSRLEKYSESRRVPPIVWALAYLGTYDRDQALHWLQVAAEDPEPYVAYFSQNQLRRNPYHHPFLDEPEFAALRKKLGYPELSE